MYGVDLAKQLCGMLQSVLWSCGSVRISFSRRTPKKVSTSFFRISRSCGAVGHHIFSIFLQVVEIITGELSSNSKVYIWDGKGVNGFCYSQVARCKV